MFNKIYVRTTINMCAVYINLNSTQVSAMQLISLNVSSIVATHVIS
jgi:hypothetical protein